MDRPFFSIIIPTKNCAGKLAATLESILSEREIPLEIVIRDGESTDGTQEVAQSFRERAGDRVRWASERDKNVYDGMNKAIPEARGRYLYFLGAGDRLRPGALRGVHDAAPAEGLALVYGDVFWEDKQTVYGGPFKRERFLFCNPSHQAIFYERALFDRFGDFDIRYPVAADWAFNMQCWGDEAVRKVYLKTLIADYEGDGISATQPDETFAREHASLARKYLHFGESDLRFFEREVNAAFRVGHEPNPIRRACLRAELIFLRRLIRPVLHRRLVGRANSP